MIFLKWIDHIIEGINTLSYENVYDLCNLLDIHIRIVYKEDKLIYNILKDNDGLYWRNKDGLELIFIKEGLHHKYKEFIIAHELGHAILHVEETMSAFHKDLIVKGKLERQATYFALKILGYNINKNDLQYLTTKDICQIISISDISQI